jgi:predicted AAA+ superfamily ATPase
MTDAIRNNFSELAVDWFQYRAYVESIVDRDVPDVASLSKADHIPRLLQLAAQFAGCLMNLSEIGRSVALDSKTTDHYLRVLEQLFLVRRLQPNLYHYRDRDLHEVDFVLENAQGQIVGIEVKAAASVTRRDFSGLDRLASVAGKRFVQGIILYDGHQVLSFAVNLRAAPLASVWA